MSKKNVSYNFKLKTGFAKARMNSEILKYSLFPRSTIEWNHQTDSQVNAVIVEAFNSYFSNKKLLTVYMRSSLFFDYMPELVFQRINTDTALLRPK